mmetsp:Transcript_23866/g.28848  ORF Transcript_23866/g.28848 Transcript_23866/m.28848 type:complete len:371 (+) Transcript_23866:223-1335(+)|eukprot:CAMPEP_0197864292 /NCGR_PEP_ID=MMETSP1438-20131217/42426_1 /TAXON_ID=1461541 /ORGANISM="Pterosperma sp., Strain CCMP1384" /LENGTH=370 /DNA_ID=CAMNT_0043482493 /DNA_START=216 /DNA_END=1328 /DNA_ORIENTATION=+
MAHYWLVALPVEGNNSGDIHRSWSYLKRKTEDEAELSENYQFAVPDLRVGNFDSLLALSDELAKVTSLAENAVTKFRRQLGELDRDQEVVNNLTVDGLPVERYLTTFQWDEAKHPARRPMKETTEKITESISNLEEELKIRSNEYNTAKSGLTALTRKAAGTLAVKDLTGIIHPDQIVESENLCTLVVVVPKYQSSDWLACYETLTQYIVPRSSQKVTEDDEYALYTVVLFKRVVDSFRTAAREKGFQVREAKLEMASSSSRVDETSRLQEQVSSKKAHLEEWCKTSYSEVFSNMMHLCAIRLFVESVLRYGLPPCFLSVLMKPNNKTEKRLRTLLAAQFGRSQDQWVDDIDAVRSGEVYPYVSFTLNIA